MHGHVLCEERRRLHPHRHQRDQGRRQPGPVLDPKGPAIASINKNEAYYGIADILGKKYETGYEPIKNAAGEIIGVYYIGYLLE